MKLLLIPEMDARLIAWLDAIANVGHASRNAPDDRILGLERGVGIEIEDVIVLDAVAWRSSGAHIPNGLEHRTRHQPGVGEAERRQAFQDGPVNITVS